MPHSSPSRLRALSLLAALAALAGCGRESAEDAARHSPNGRIEALLTVSDAPVLALATGDTVQLGDEMREFYRARGYEAAWTSEEGFLPRGQALVAALHEADSDGLDLVEYHEEGIHDMIERAKLDVEQGLPVGDLLGNIDLLLTESFLRYTTDLRQGTIDPSVEGLDWRVPREDDTDVAFLNALVESEDFEAALASLRPDVPFYERLRAGLARYREVAESGGWPTVDEGESLAEGDRSPRVVQIRRRLIAEGDPVEAPLAEGATAPDLFDERLARAVQHFQDRHGLTEDGAVGAGTVSAFNVPVEERLSSIRLNLDRWRWLPRDFGDHYILVNIAGYEMAVMRDHEAVLSMNVVVGQVGNQTPVFRDTMEHVVVNPYWNVPIGIAREEIFPAADRDPGYLARNHYELVGSGSARTVRQTPGPWNALGEVKFLFPNEHDVYLHDTPADHLFGREARAFSHGCVRLEKPLELAHYLFENAAGLSSADFDRMKGGGEKWVTLKEKLPVYILYFTAWGAEDGSIHFYQDVYDRDRRVEQVAGAKLYRDSVPSAEGERMALRAEDAR